MLDQEAWISVVTDPIGITAFALFLVFLLITKYLKSESTPWLTPVFVGMAALVLIGGLFLSYNSQNRNTQDSTPATSNNPTITIKGETHGEGSPIIGTVGGDVNIGGDTNNK